jgi:hypothetical protein
VTLVIPKIKATARYRSSGVLLLIKASGGGDYWGEYGECSSYLSRLGIKIPIYVDLIADGVKAKMYFKARPRTVRGTTYLSLEQMKMDFSVKEITMGVENLHNGNSIIRKKERERAIRIEDTSLTVRFQMPP